MTGLLPDTNADGLPVVPMTDEQRYFFDLKGWLLLPSLLAEEQLGPIQEHQMRFLRDRESLPAEERDNHGGPSQVLLDHPAVVGVLNEVLSHQALATPDCYGFRYDHTYTSFRETGHDNFSPHGGGGFFNFEGNSPHLPDAARQGARGAHAGGVGAERGRPRRGRNAAAVGQPQDRLSRVPRG